MYDCLIYLFYYENKQAAQQQQWLLLQMAIAIKADRPATTKEISVISKLLAALCVSLVFFLFCCIFFFVAFVFAAWKLTSSLLFSVGFISLLLGQLVAFVTFQFFLAGNAEFAQKPTENWHKNVLILSCLFPFFFHPFTRAPKINILN